MARTTGRDTTWAGPGDLPCWAGVRPRVPTTGHDLPLYSDLVGSGRIVVPALGAVLLGVGAIFQPKAKADDHWATSQRVVMVLEAQSEQSGDPPSTAY